MRLLYTGRAPSRGLGLALAERNARVAAAFGLDPHGRGAYLLAITRIGPGPETTTVVAGGDHLDRITTAGAALACGIADGHAVVVTAAAGTRWDVLDLRS